MKTRWETIATSDTKENAIARVRQMQQWQPDIADARIMIQRDYVPKWFYHLVRETPFEFLGYYYYCDVL